MHRKIAGSIANCYGKPKSPHLFIWSLLWNHGWGMVGLEISWKSKLSMLTSRNGVIYRGSMGFQSRTPLSLISLRYMFIQHNLRLVPILWETHSTCTRPIIRDIQINPENHIRELCHTTHSPNSSIWGNYHDAVVCLAPVWETTRASTQTTNGFVYNSRYTAYLEGRRHPLLHQDENGAGHAEHSHEFINNSLPANFCKFNLDLLRNCRIWRRGWDIIGSRETLSSLRFLSILVTNKSFILNPQQSIYSKPCHPWDFPLLGIWSMGRTEQWWKWPHFLFISSKLA